MVLPVPGGPYSRAGMPAARSVRSAVDVGHVGQHPGPVDLPAGAGHRRGAGAAGGAGGEAGPAGAGAGTVGAGGAGLRGRAGAAGGARHRAAVAGVAR